MIVSDGRYDPDADEWTTMSTAPWTDAYTAVWTGAEMVIWGGTAGFGYVTNDGGRYNPDTDTWTSTPAMDAPEARKTHTAIWTGTAMIVWGAYFWNGFSWTCLNSGGRLCAAAPCAVSTWYSDDDGDGHGLAEDSVLSCVVPPHYVVAGDDCDDAEPGAWSSPAEASGLRLTRITGGTRLDWASQSATAGSATVYDVVTGQLGQLCSTRSFAGATCLVSDLQTPSHEDTREPPAPGACSYFVPRARNVCGAGTYGNSSVAPDPRDLLDAAGPCP
jgi:hypothetical protein